MISKISSMTILASAGNDNIKKCGHGCKSVTAFMCKHFIYRKLISFVCVAK